MNSHTLLMILLIMLLLSSCPQESADAPAAGSGGSGSSLEQDSQPQDADPDADATEDQSNGAEVAPDEEPAGDAAAEPGTDDAAGDVPNPNAVGEQAEAVKEVARNMTRAMVTGDRAGYIACFHPDSPELEEMTRMFDEIQPTIVAVQVINLEVTEATGEFAMLQYEFSISESGKEQRSESGSMELVRTGDGSWQIMDMN